MMDQKDYSYYLIREFENRLQKNSSYSLRAYARDLKLNPATLSQVFSKKSILSMKNGRKILHELNLSGTEEEEFMNNLCSLHKKRNLKRIPRELREYGAESKKSISAKEIDLEKFKVISEWYYYAILEMTYTKELKVDIESVKRIAKRLELDQNLVSFAIKRLLDLDLLYTDEMDILRKRNRVILTSDREATSLAHKNRQKQILEKSIEAIDKQSFESRCHSAMTLPIDKNLIPGAKKKIDDFLNEFVHYFGTGEKNNVYELSINLFSLEKELLECSDQS